MKIKLKYQHVSIALDVLTAGVGALGGPVNAMTAVAGKRGIESAISHSIRAVQKWRAERELPAPEPQKPEAEVIPPTSAKPQQGAEAASAAARPPKRGRGDGATTASAS
jgi:hypothetical protein